MASVASQKPAPASGGKSHNVGTNLVAVRKPDEEEYRRREDVETVAIAKLSATLRSISDDIRSKGVGRDEYQNRIGEFRRTIDETLKSVGELENERDAILSKLSDQQQRSKAKKSQLDQMKKDIDFTSVEDIDARIEEIERFMISNTVPLSQEKQFIAQIQQLQRKKPAVADFRKKETADIQSDTTAGMKTRLGEVRDEITKLRAKRRDTSSRLQSLVDERKSNTAPIKHLYIQREELEAELKEHRKTLSEIKDEKFNAQNAYNAYIQKLRMARKDAERVEQRRRDLERQKEKIMEQIELLDGSTIDPPGYALLTQVITYLESRVATYKPAVASMSPTSQTGVPLVAKNMDDEDGNTILLPKGQRHEDHDVPASKKLKRRERKGGSKKSNILTHDIRSLADFREVGIEPPLTVEEAEECVVKLKEDHAALESKRSEYEEKENMKKQKMLDEVAVIDKKLKDELEKDVEALESANA